MDNSYVNVITEKMGRPSGYVYLLTGLIVSIFTLIGYLGVYYASDELVTFYDKFENNVNLLSGADETFAQLTGGSNSSSQSGVEFGLDLFENTDFENAIKVLSKVNLAAVILQSGVIFMLGIFILFYEFITKPKWGSQIWYLNIFVIAPSVINIFFISFGFLLFWFLDVLSIILKVLDDSLLQDFSLQEGKEATIGDIFNVGELPAYKGFQKFLPSRHEWVIFSILMGIIGISFLVSFVFSLTNDSVSSNIRANIGSSKSMRYDSSPPVKEQSSEKRKAAGSMYF